MHDFDADVNLKNSHRYLHSLFVPSVLILVLGVWGLENKEAPPDPHSHPLTVAGDITQLLLHEITESQKLYICMRVLGSFDSTPEEFTPPDPTASNARGGFWVCGMKKSHLI